MRREWLCFVGLRISLVSLLLLVKIFLCGQIKWDGGAGDGQWSNPLNWAGDLLPSTADDVILDHSLLSGTYEVRLPSGNVSTVIRSLQILPGASDSIRLELPKTNTVSPGLQVSGSVYPIVIGARGVLVNSSGSSSGSSVVITDSLKILDGGTYIHRTARAHATLVSLLSRSPGTEKGIFWFDIPGVSSTISLSDRNFGALVLTATAAGGALNYTAASTRKIRVRSDLLIGKGVKLNLNCSDTFHVQGSLIQEGGTLNLSSNTRLLVLAVGGDVNIKTGSVVTETGTAVPVLLINGTSSQQISFSGSIVNQVIIRLNNGAGAVLQSPLSVPYVFDLLKGKLSTGSTSVLIIQAGAILKADSINLSTFVNGPLRIQGLVNAANRLFPVGASNELRWMALKNATGDFTVEYHRSNPRSIDSRMVSINHISGNEYWSIQSPGNASASANIELSFNDGNQSGVTELSSLQTARLGIDGWIDAGNQSTSGTAGGRGSVQSVLQAGLATGDNVLFTLAGSISSENPLPLESFAVTILDRKEYASALISLPRFCVGYEVQEFNGSGFISAGLHPVADAEKEKVVEEKILRHSRAGLYRIAIFMKNHSILYSAQFRIGPGKVEPGILKGWRFAGTLELELMTKMPTPVFIQLMTVDGRILKADQRYLEKGFQKVSINIGYIPTGPVVLSIQSLFGQESRIILITH